MGGKLSVHIDTNVELIDIYIFTPGQGICLEKRCSPFADPMIVFQSGLGYGSWYEMLVHVRRSNTYDQQEAYMLKGIYLTVNKCVQLSEVLKWNNRIGNGEKWQCAEKTCEKLNEYDVNICLHCYRNKASKIVSFLSNIPIVGLPFSVTNAVLESGRAARTGESKDIADAVVATVVAATDIVLTPMLVGSLVKIPATAAAKTGTQLTTKTLFSNIGATAGSVAMEEVGTFIARRNIVVKATKTIVNDEV